MAPKPQGLAYRLLQTIVCDNIVASYVHWEDTPVTISADQALGAAESTGRPAFMVAVAIFSTDPVLRRNLEQLPHDDSAVALVGIVDHPSSVPELLNQDHVDVLLADAPTRELLAEYRGRHDRIALVVLLDGVDAADSVRALNAGARAVLHRSSNRVPSSVVG